MRIATALRAIARLLCIAGCVIGIVLFSSTPVYAISDARRVAADSIRAQVNAKGLSGPAVDLAIVRQAWTDAGVHVADIHTIDDILHASTPLDPTQKRPDGPVEGDIIVYTDVNGQQRIGMYVSPSDVVIWDPVQRVLIMVPRPEVSNDLGDAPVSKQYTSPDSHAQSCRLSKQRWPYGIDDTSAGIGKVALADPQMTSAHFQWLQNHPRDADNNIFHVAAVSLLKALALGSAVLSGTLGFLGTAISWGLHHSGPIGGIVLAVLGWLGSSFDGRGLHRILVGGIITALPGLSALLGLGAWMKTSKNRALSAIGQVLVSGVVGGASLIVGVFTGVDDSDHARVGNVIVALVCDAVFVLKPLGLLRAGAEGAAAAARGLGLSGAWGRLVSVAANPAIAKASGMIGKGSAGVLDIAHVAGESVAVHPGAFRFMASWANAVRSRGLSDVIRHGLSDADILGRGTKMDIAFQVGDVGSLAWRRSSIPAELLARTSSGLKNLSAAVDSSATSGIGGTINSALDQLSSTQRAQITGALKSIAEGVSSTEKMNSLHGGSVTLSNAAAGHPPPPLPFPQTIGNGAAPIPTNVPSSSSPVCPRL